MKKLTMADAVVSAAVWANAATPFVKNGKPVADVVVEQKVADKTIEVDGPTAYKTVQLFPDLKMVNRGFGFDLVVLGDRPLKAGEWPGVCRDYTLYIPGTNRTDWLVYKLSCDLTERKTVGAAAPRAQFYTLQPRFYAVAERRFRVRSLYLPSRSRPLLGDGPRDESPKSCAGEGGGNWQFRFTFNWEQLEGLYPLARSAWYLRQGDEAVKIVWRNRLDCFSGIEFRHVVQNYEKECQAVLSNWSFEDPLFCAIGVQPLVDANTELVKMLKKKVQPNGYISWTPSDKFIKEKAAANFNRVRYFKEDVDAGRIRYLDDVLAGREVKAPVRKKVFEEKKPKGPSLDEDEGQKYERGRVERAMNHWKGKVRKAQTSDLSADEDVISLDE